ncbi:14514_t:CDS:2, partial [Acaulospora colombiana]
MNNINRDNDNNTLITVETDEPDRERLEKMCENGFIIDNVIKKPPEQAFEFNVKTLNIKEGFYEETLECHDKIEDLCKRNLITSASVSAATPWLPLFLEGSYENSSSMARSRQKMTKYTVEKHLKAEIKISDVRLSEKFVKEVKAALGEGKSRNKNDMIQKLRKITERYGHFYAKRIVFGGAIVKGITNERISKNRSENQKFSIKTLIGSFMGSTITRCKEKSDIEVNSEIKSNSQIFGGNKYDPNNKRLWVKSLEDPKKWEIIGYDEIYPIFDLLDDDLKKEILEIFGQIIRDVNTEDIHFEMNINDNIPFEFRLHEKLEFSANINQYKIYTSIMNKKEKDIFSLRVHYYDEYSPVIFIHRIDCSGKSNEKSSEIVMQEFNIQIGWIIFGYPEELNFGQIQNHMTFSSWNLNRDRSKEYFYRPPELPREPSHGSCILSTCISKSLEENTESSSTTKTSSFDHSKTTIITSLHLSLDEHS